MTNLLTGMMAASGVSTSNYVGDPPSGFSARWRADDVTLSGSIVTSWNDTSGNGYHLERWDTNYGPTYTESDSNFNNNPSIKFGGDMGGSNFYNMKTASGVTMTTIFGAGGSAGPVTLAFVCKHDPTQSSFNYSQIVGDYYGDCDFKQDSDTQITGGSFNSAVGSGVKSGVYWQNKAGTGNQTLQVSGQTAQTGSGASWNYDGYQMLIGGNNNAGFYYFGWIAEIIIYPTYLSGGDITTLKNYIANSYTITW